MIGHHLAGVNDRVMSLGWETIAGQIGVRSRRPGILPGPITHPITRIG
jgi:hypothetical protein